mgnify:CR=1 FL=1
MIASAGIPMSSLNYGTSPRSMTHHVFLRDQIKNFVAERKVKRELRAQNSRKQMSQSDCVRRDTDEQSELWNVTSIHDTPICSLFFVLPMRNLCRLCFLSRRLCTRRLTCFLSRRLFTRRLRLCILRHLSCRRQSSAQCQDRLDNRCRAYQSPRCFP